MGVLIAAFSAGLPVSDAEPVAQPVPFAGGGRGEAGLALLPKGLVRAQLPYPYLPSF